VKKSILAPIVALGLIAGFELASLFWPVQSRAERIATLFKDYCLPYARGKDLTSQALINLVAEGGDLGTTRWLDTKSASYLSFKPNRCVLETTAPNALSRPQSAELSDLIEAIVMQEFSDVTFDPTATLGPETLSKGWFTGRPQSAQRRGVFFSAYPDWGASAGSILFLASPTQ
jgi:hypothetical protein